MWLQNGELFASIKFSGKRKVRYGWFKINVLYCIGASLVIMASGLREMEYITPSHTLGKVLVG